MWILLELPLVDRLPVSNQEWAAISRMGKANDSEFVRSQYRDGTNLGVRQRFHQLYSENKEGWPAWVFRNLSLPESGSVLELGCSNADLWRNSVHRVSPTLRITLTDISPGLLDKAKENLGPHAGRFHFEQVDACRLPYETGTFDVIIANHMLYHLPDLDMALSGMRRILKNDGLFYASTMGAGNLRELKDFVTQCGWNVDLDLSSAAKVFGLENGEGILKKHFSQVDLLRYTDSLIVPSPEAVVEYLASFFPSQPMPARLGQALQEEIDRRGAIRISKTAGMFQCR